MPDYDQPYWQIHPGEDYARNIAQARQRHDQEAQRQFENNRQTTDDQNAYAQQMLDNNLRAKAAADTYLKQRDYAAGIDQLTKQYPQGGPDFDRAMALLALKTTGPTAGAATQFARGIETPSKPAGTPPWLAGMMQPTAPSMSAPAVGAPPPVAVPGGFGPETDFPVIPPPGVSAPKPPAAGMPTFTPPAGMIFNGRTLVRDPSYTRPQMPAGPVSTVPIPGGNIVSGGGLPSARVIPTHAPANSAVTTAAMVAKRSALMAQRKQAVAALTQAAKDKNTSGIGQANADIARIDKQLMNFGSPEAPATDSQPDSDSQPPAEAPSPMPKTKAELKKGTVYQTSGGPGTWNGEGFDLQ